MGKNSEKVWKSAKKVWKSAETVWPFSCCPLVFLWEKERERPLKTTIQNTITPQISFELLLSFFLQLWGFEVDFKTRAKPLYAHQTPVETLSEHCTTSPHRGIALGMIFCIVAYIAMHFRNDSANCNENAHRIAQGHFLQYTSNCTNRLLWPHLKPWNRAIHIVGSKSTSHHRLTSHDLAHLIHAKRQSDENALPKRFCNFSALCEMLQNQGKTYKCIYLADHFHKWENSVVTNNEHMQGKCRVGGADKL